MSNSGLTNKQFYVIEPVRVQNTFIPGNKIRIATCYK